jgi:hypothetical protein
LLQAILNGKAGRIDVEGNGATISWKQLFQTREDLLTSAFFNRFAYLSPIIQHRILKYIFDGTGDFTCFEGIDYWPKYDLPDHDDRHFVEPDLLIKFKDFDILVEVKPPQGGYQYVDQWRAEIEGYFAQEHDVKEVYFLAIGRIESVSKKERDNILQDDKYKLKGLAVLSWKSVAKNLYQLFHSDEPLAQDKFILSDMLGALSLYGIRGNDLHWSTLRNFFPPFSYESMKTWCYEPLTPASVQEHGSSFEFQKMITNRAPFNLGKMKKWTL